MAYKILFRKWRLRPVFWWSMVLELGLVVSLLVLFGIAQPDMYRTSLWQIGYEHRFNSNPKMILYAYANHRPLPTIPFVWSRKLTDFNVAISIISLFVLLAKLISFIMKVYFPIIGVAVATVMTALYTTSVYGQMGPDHADPRYPSAIAWYIRMGCEPAEPYNLVRSCQLAKGTFAVTVIMLFFYLCTLALAIYAMLPNKETDKEIDDDESQDSPIGKDYEMTAPQNHVPFTPRTQAFHTLERKLPLRS